MDNRPTDRDAPLQAEQRNRAKWREGETILEEKDVLGQTLPESERDRAASETGSKSMTDIAPPPD